MKLSTNASVVKFLNAVPELKLPAHRTISDASDYVTHRLPIRQYLAMVASLKAFTEGTATKAMLLPHPRQRNTRARLAKAVGQGGHLAKLTASHVDIVIALFEGQLYLVDGNHRSLYWLEYDIATLPSHVNLIIKRFDDEDAFKELYYQYDSKAAVETGRQKLFGYMSDAGYAKLLKTAFVRGGCFLSALKHLRGFVKGNEAEFMKAWREEFLALDAALDGDKTKFDNGAVAALLNLFHTEQHADVRAFIRQLQRVEMFRKDLQLDGIPMSPAQVIIDKLWKALSLVQASNNEGIIARKMQLTLKAYADFRSVLDLVHVPRVPAAKAARTKKAA